MSNSNIPILFYEIKHHVQIYFISVSKNNIILNIIIVFTIGTLNCVNCNNNFSEEKCVFHKWFNTIKGHQFCLIFLNIYREVLDDIFLVTTIVWYPSWENTCARYKSKPIGHRKTPLFALLPIWFKLKGACPLSSENKCVRVYTVYMY